MRLPVRSRRAAPGLVSTVLAISGAAALLALPVSAAPSAPASTTFAFSNYELSSTVGTTCPNTTGGCTNGAAEPAIRADLAGNIYASSENGLGAGTEAWKSTSGGASFTTLVEPDAGSQTNSTGFAPGGGDTDLAVAPAKNLAGNYNVYVASLSLANVDVSTSTDGGKTWTLNPIGATISGDDREWIAADGASKVCISYHDVATFNIDVNCSNSAGAAGSFTQLGDAIDTSHAYNINNNEIGNLMIDPKSHIVYQTFSGIDQSDLQQCETTGPCNYHVVYMAVSTDGGKTFTDYKVYDNPNTSVSYGHQFVNVSIDKAGNVYSVYTDNHNVYYSVSKDHGQTWTAPFQVNKKPANTAIMPWSVAGGSGRIDIVYYGTSYYDGVNPPDSYPSTAAWYVYMAQSQNAAGSTPTFKQVAASPINHYGGVCESGVTCSGNRDLYDDFGVTADPLTGFATIVYSDDQYSASAASSSCTSANTNTSSCDHTEIANQTAGGRIYSVKSSA